ncbi:MAG: hypothetical protein AAF721_21845 [Myxococcota bacterium]
MGRFGWGLVIALGGPACGDDGDTPDPDAGASTADDTGPGGGSTSADSQAESGTAGDPDGDSDESGGFVPADCSEPCADDTETAVALCYACRCKNAMDGWLPTPEQLQCSQAEELTVYTADISGENPQLVPLTEEAETCVNPALLTETCGVGSRFGQLQEGDVYVKWICRDPFDDGALFADVGVIMHNVRNGASCWFDDIDSVTGMDDIPNLDLMAGDEANLQSYLEKFYFTDGETCTRDCHGADPFVYTPYFESIVWQTGAWVNGLHRRVTLDEELAPVEAFELLSPEVTVCTGCHRVGSTASCDFLAPDALGLAKTAAHEPSVHDAMDPASPNWWLAYWMPKPFPAVDTLEDWTGLFGAARDRIVECCADPGVSTPNCIWEPIANE